MFGLVIDPRLAIHPVLEKPDTAASGPGLAVSCNPALPRQGLVWRGGAESLAKEIGSHRGVSESVLAMDGYASCLS